MAPMKRPAAAAAAGVAKKGRKASAEAAQKKIVLEQCKAVAAAVQHNTTYPKDVIKMLSQNVTSCLSIAQEERHQYQVNVIEMVQAVLNSSEQSLKELLAAAQAKVADVEDAKTGRQSAVEASIAATASKTAEAETAKAAHTEALDAVKAAKAALNATKSSSAAEHAEFTRKDEQKQHLESLQTSLASADDEGLSAQVSTALTKAGKELGFDASLLGSIPSAVQKTPDTRGVFDSLVIQQAREELTKHIQTLAAALAASEPAQAERAAKIDAETADVAAKEALEVTAKEAVTAAEHALKQAEDDQKAANKSLKALGPETKQAKLELDTCQSDLKSFTEGPSAAFQQLLILSNVPVPEPEPEAHEPPAAQEEPALPVEELAAAVEAPTA